MKSARHLWVVERMHTAGYWEPTAQIHFTRRAGMERLKEMRLDFYEEFRLVKYAPEAKP